MAAEPTRRMALWPGICASTVSVMSMTQLVIGTAIGFIVAQGGLYGMQRLVGWLQREQARKRIRELIPSLGSSFIGGFTRYAALAGASAAVIMLGIWAVADHMAAKSARS